MLVVSSLMPDVGCQMDCDPIVMHTICLLITWIDQQGIKAYEMISGRGYSGNQPVKQRNYISL